MTDRTISLLVVLEEEYRIDNVELIVNAIKMIKGVDTVETNILQHMDYLNRYAFKVKVRQEIIKKVMEIE